MHLFLTARLWPELEKSSDDLQTANREESVEAGGG